MGIAIWCTVGLVLAGAAQAQNPASKVTPDDYRQMAEDQEYWQSQRDRYQQIALRARELYPQRRDIPLRELNISDDEIREVEFIARRFLPRAYVNISPVVTECPCEEGPTCTAQVYVIATGNGKTRGLQLSRLNDRWIVGMVQQWWIRFEALVRPRTGNPFLDSYLFDKARNELYEEFPRCTGKLVPAQQSAASQKPAPSR